MESSEYGMISEKKMTVKEKNERLLEKWSFLIDEIADKKSLRIRFAKIFENTALYSDTAYSKIAFAILQRFLYTHPSIKLSSSIKNSIDIDRIDKEVALDSGQIMPDAVANFVMHVNNILTGLIESETLEKINHIQIKNSSSSLFVSVVF